MFSDKSLFEVIDMPEKEFRKEIKTLNLGETLSLKNYLNLTWDRVNIIKEKLVEKGKNSTDNVEVLEIAKNVQGLLAKMMSMELKCCILKERADSLIKSTGVFDV